MSEPQDQQPKGAVAPASENADVDVRTEVEAPPGAPPDPPAELSPDASPHASSSASEIAAAGAPVLQTPKKKRFRWGCFFIANFFMMLVVLLLLLLFWPVPQKERGPEAARNPSVITEGGAEIEIVSVERLGQPRFYFGPGKENFGRLLVTARITNQTNVAHAVDLGIFQMRDGYRAQYRPKPDETEFWYEQQNMEEPWDRPLKPRESATVRAVFVIQLPERGLRLFVRKGFDWNSLTYLPVAFSMKREYKEIRRDAQTAAAEDEVRDVGEVRVLRKKSDLR